jgi:hypothetical protein
MDTLQSEPNAFVDSNLFCVLLCWRDHTGGAMAIPIINFTAVLYITKDDATVSQFKIMTAVW